jgi:hypothetical protein
MGRRRPETTHIHVPSTTLVRAWLPQGHRVLKLCATPGRVDTPFEASTGSEGDGRGFQGGSRVPRLWGFRSLLAAGLGDPTPVPSGTPHPSDARPVAQMPMIQKRGAAHHGMDGQGSAVWRWGRAARVLQPRLWQDDRRLRLSSPTLAERLGQRRRDLPYAECHGIAWQAQGSPIA